ncbi:MFS transporter [Actinospica sp. MGRD01-02]|uniref:MFS transporter n=1 Tax=Actinospica acidithermotolerans TaxID=2828514 RepID=A0A941IJT1_9ACTN|nr:MFS transporter [Actinospica acidithermotolerans]MBR7828207.1 MFS transporter [Actinospica acidithermotolerans]
MILRSERARPERIRAMPRGWWFAIATVCFGAFMGQLDASIATLTYPALRTQFHAGLAAVSWVSLSYLLTLVALLVPVGRLSDVYGRKLLYLYGFIVFTAASAACGLAPSLTALIAFRVVQAVGAALLQANSVALVTTSAPRERMRAALGVQAGAQALGLALGPTLGGLIVSGLGWRWVFYVNLPVGVIAVIAGHYLLPRTRAKTPPGRFDWSGLALLATASTNLLLGISAASGLNLPPAATACLFAAALGAGYGFWRRISRALAPLVDPALLRTRQIAAGLAGALGGYLVLFGPLVLVPVVLTETGTSLAGAGAILTALPAGFAAAALGANRVLPAAWSDRTRALAGSALATAAMIAMVPAPFTPAYLGPLLAVLGLGLGAFTPANNTLVMGAIPARSAGTGGGLLNMTRGLGTALGVALVALVLHVVPGTRHATMAATGLLALVTLAVCASNLLHPRHHASDHAAAEPLEL